MNGTWARILSHITLETRIHGGSCRAAAIKSQLSSRFVRTPLPVRMASDMSLGLRSFVNLRERERERERERASVRERVCVCV